MAGKEYTTAPILVNADGHPIPQYLDITDTTDSPQGTFKPLTQLQAEHPDVQNVQLTGSIVLLSRVLNIPLAAGSKSYLLSNSSGLHDFKHVIVAVSADTTHNFDCALTYYVSERNVGAGAVIYEQFKDKFVETEGQSKSVLEPIPILGDSLSVRVFNNDTVDHNYDVHAWGVR